MPRGTKSRAPLATQRSDDWRIHEIPVKFGDQADRQSLNQARPDHRLFDMQRRLNDAQRLLDENQENNSKEIENWNAK